ncbi:MAG: RNA polymerase sigma factor, partial [Candidatus Geothermincolia bacterium]
MQDTRQDLTLRIRAGDGTAVEQAYDAFFAPVINFVYYMLYDYDTASDISQEAFLRTVEACRDEKKDVRDFKSYLFGTARNLAMTHMGQAKKFADVSEETLAFEDPNIFADPARAALLGEQRAAVAAAT